MNGATQATLIGLPTWRSHAVMGLLLLAFAVLFARAVYLQGLHHEFLQQKGESRYGRVIALSATRGNITDRNGEPLAISTPVESVWGSPSDVEITPDRTQRLAYLLGLDRREIAKRLGDTGHDFVYLRRQLPPEQAAKVVELDIPGIFLQREYRRYYPASETMAHVIGFTDVDDKGQEGLELALNKDLLGAAGSRRVIKDRLGHIVEDVESIRAPRPGKNITLSIDAKLQYLAYRELRNAVANDQAKAGGIVVLDAKTGEVLAMANVPTYNPNNRVGIESNRTRNRVITDLFEPGSTLKPFTVATVLDAGLFKPDTLINTGSGQLTIGSATIHDAHPEGILTVSQVIQKSSNVGAAKMALTLPPQKMWTTFEEVGIGSPPRSGFPGESSGRLRPYGSWRPIEQATMAYGHGISLSLLQLARAYMIFASDGEIRPVTLMKREDPVPGTRVISSATAHEVRAMLELVVKPGGTAPRAQVPGYRVAGKTGTAHKAENGGYSSHKYISSFIGFAPASDPRLIVAVMIDEPSAGRYYGGTVAAPAFANVMAGALRLLNVSPDAPLNNVVLPPPSAAEIPEDS